MITIFRHARSLALAPLVGWGILAMTAASEVTVRPARIDDVLTNQNMGFADFHMGFHCEAPELSAEECVKRQGLKWPANHPKTAVSYFRWYWDQLEPEEGAIDFGYMDTRIRASNGTGQTLAFRVMAVRENGSGVPAWLRGKIKGIEVDGTFFRIIATRCSTRRMAGSSKPWLSDMTGIRQSITSTSDQWDAGASGTPLASKVAAR